MRPDPIEMIATAVAIAVWTYVIGVAAYILGTKNVHKEAVDNGFAEYVVEESADGAPPSIRWRWKEAAR